MKNILLLILITLLLNSFSAFAQPQTAYYDGTEGKDGAELKSTIHNIIDNHVLYSYTDVWSILQQSDEDPANSDNVILVYTGRSQNKSWRDRGSDYDYEAAGYTLNDSYNREHVWAKSHGDFGTETGTGTDAHALKPVDRTVNSSRSYKDFDNGGTAHSEAVDCNYDSDSWEPRDEVKGDIARIILYMDARYEGTNDELNLTAVDQVNTFPNPTHGKLSTLLEWHKNDPPDAFEMRRNNVICTWQKNRNPFIDHPEFVDLIWNGINASDILISNIGISIEKPSPTDAVTVSAEITADESILEATLNYRTTFEQVSTTSITMSAETDNYSAVILAQAEGTKVYYYITARTAVDTVNSVTYMYEIETPFEGTITSITQIQGEEATSPYVGESVSLTGIVTGVFGTSFYIQDAGEVWSGVYVYNSGYSPTRGDSVIITGKVEEYFNLTEIKELTYFKVVSSYNPLPTPIVITTSNLSAASTTAEQYESVLVKIENAEFLRDTLYGMWFVNDGSGECLIHNPNTYSYSGQAGTILNITGIATYNYGENKVDIRDADDVEAAEDVKAPYIDNISVAGAQTIIAYFNEDVETESATDTSNYSFSDGIVIEEILQHAFEKNRISFTVHGLTIGDHTLIVSGVKDLNENIMETEIYTFNSTYAGIDELKNSLQIFPNPITDYLNIYSDNGISSITIFNEIGQKMLSKKMNNEKSIEIDASLLHKGIYLLQIDYGGNSIIEKLIIK